MKKTILFTMLLFSSAAALQAQLNVHINIGSQPLWGPIGYDRVQYYYLPECQAYYHVPSRQFIYLNGNNWIFAAALPGRFGNINLFNTYKVVINEPRPYLHHMDYLNRYSMERGWRAPQQIVIRDSRNYRDDRDDRYRYDRDERREHGRYYGNRRNSRGNGDREY